MSWSSLLAGGAAIEARGVNILDGGAPRYQLYATADGGHMAVAALEPQFYAEMLRLAGVEHHDDDAHMRATLTAVFATRTRAEWTDVFAGTDACVAPVLSHSEAAAHPHMAARGVFLDVQGLAQPAPAPRFSRTPGALTTPPSRPGEHTREALERWGVDPEPLLRTGSAVQA